MNITNLFWMSNNRKTIKYLAQCINENRFILNISTKELTPEDFCLWFKQKKMPLCLLLRFFVFCYPASLLNGLFINITTIIVRLLHDQTRNQAFLQTANTCIRPLVIFLFAKKISFLFLFPRSLSESKISISLISLYRFV